MPRGAVVHISLVLLGHGVPYFPHMHSLRRFSALLVLLVAVGGVVPFAVQAQSAGDTQDRASLIASLMEQVRQLQQRVAELIAQRSSSSQGQVFCTQEAKQCSDGSYVSRTGPQCEFAACPGGGSNGEPGGPPSTGGTQCVDFSRDLSVGMSGSDVTSLQRMLVMRGFLAQSSITGYFGQQTQTALSSFQTQEGISGTGYAGPKTRAAIACEPPPATGTSTSPGGTVDSTWVDPNGNSDVCAGGSCSSGVTSDWSAGAAPTDPNAGVPACTVTVPQPQTACSGGAVWSFIPTDDQCHGSWQCVIGL